MQNLISRMDAKTRMLLTVLIFLNVTIFGCLCLLLTQKIVLP